MKVLMLNGSANPDGCTNRALIEVGNTLKNEFGIDFEIFQITNKPIRDCIGCNKCTSEGCIFSKIDNYNWEDKTKAVADIIRMPKDDVMNGLILQKEGKQHIQTIITTTDLNDLSIHSGYRLIEIKKGGDINVEDRC